MSFQEPSRSPLKIAAYTGYAWENSLPVLRIAGPVNRFGGELIKGVEGHQVYPERVSQADLVIVQREFPRNREAFGKILERARAEGKPLVLDLDDLLLELPEDHPDRISHHYADALLPLAQALVEAEAVTTSSARLQEVLRQFNPHTWLLPNYLDDRLWAFRTPAERALNGSPAEAGPVVVGYMGGSSHAPDLEAIAPILARLLENYGAGLCLRFYGLRPPASLAGLAGVEWIPLAEVDYARFAQFFGAQKCDLYIAPLQDNLFNHCKSAIKFLEYSTSATPGVYSRVAPYETVIRQGENGFLASTLPEWEEYLSRLIEGPGLRAELGLRAQLTVKEGWLLSEHAGQWLETYQSICAQAAAPRALSPGLRIGLSLAQQVEVFHQARGAEAGREIEGLEWRALEAGRALAQAHAQCEALERSKAWRVARFLRRLRLWLLPAGSRRERLVSRLAGERGKWKSPDEQ
jgi:glycosyltransferase involved in cell wall biosynthesis